MSLVYPDAGGTGICHRCNFGPGRPLCMLQCPSHDVPWRGCERCCTISAARTEGTYVSCTESECASPAPGSRHFACILPFSAAVLGQGRWQQSCRPQAGSNSCPCHCPLHIRVCCCAESIIPVSVPAKARAALWAARGWFEVVASIWSGPDPGASQQTIRTSLKWSKSYP